MLTARSTLLIKINIPNSKPQTLETHTAISKTPPLTTKRSDAVLAPAVIKSTGDLIEN